MGRSKLVAVWLVVLLVAAAPSIGQVSLSLPLQGYYRAGRYMPVDLQLSGDLSASPLTLQTDEPLTVPTEIGPAFFSLARQNFTAVLIVSDRAAHLNQLPLHALLADQRLVGVLDSSVDAAMVQSVFPGMSMIPVRIEPGLLQAEIAPALESLDAIAMTDWPMDVARQQALHMLRGRGVTLVVTGATQVKPDDLPWKQQGSLWVCPPARLLPPMICPAAYEPAMGWNPGRPARFRMKVVIIGIICTLLLGLISLMRNRWAPAAILAISAALAIGVVMWNRVQPITAQASGTICLQENPATSSLDIWHYYVSAVAGDICLGSNFAHPVFYDETQLAAAHPQYRAGQTGADGLYLRGAPGFVLAALTTHIGQPFSCSWQPTPVPIAKLTVPAIYPGWLVDGQQASNGGENDLGIVRLRRRQP